MENGIKSVKIRDKEFFLHIPAQKIADIVSRLTVTLNADYQGKRPVFIPVLNGSFIFASDLVRKIDFACEISFIKLASYLGTESSGSLQKLIGLNTDVKGKSVLILEDIIDTGNTISFLVNEIKKHGPSEIKICTLLMKPGKYSEELKIDYVGMEIENDFVVGYGMDYGSIGRNFPDIYKLKK